MISAFIYLSDFSWLCKFIAFSCKERACQTGSRSFPVSFSEAVGETQGLVPGFKNSRS